MPKAVADVCVATLTGPLAAGCPYKHQAASLCERGRAAAAPHVLDSAARYSVRRRPRQAPGSAYTVVVKSFRSVLAVITNWCLLQHNCRNGFYLRAAGFCGY